MDPLIPRAGCAAEGIVFSRVKTQIAQNWTFSDHRERMYVRLHQSRFIVLISELADFFNCTVVGFQRCVCKKPVFVFRFLWRLLWLVQNLYVLAGKWNTSNVILNLPQVSISFLLEVFDWMYYRESSSTLVSRWLSAPKQTSILVGQFSEISRRLSS